MILYTRGCTWTQLTQPRLRQLSDFKIFVFYFVFHSFIRIFVMMFTNSVISQTCMGFCLRFLRLSKPLWHKLIVNLIDALLMS